MKTNFKKTMSVLLAVLMLAGIFSVTAFAAVYNVTIAAGSAAGSTLKTGITNDMLSIKTNSSGKFNLPDEPYFERENYVQDGWTKTAGGGGTLLAFGASQTVRNNTTKFYPHWRQAVFTFTFNPGNYYDETDPNNFSDAGMTQVKELTMTTDGTDAQPIILPGAMYTREGYEQTGWCTAKSNNGTGTRLEFGSVYDKTLTKDVTLYPFWKPIVYTVRFEGGAYGVGTAQEVEVAYGKTTRAPGEIFTREDYTQIGWSTVENSDVVELALNANSSKIDGDTIFYPVWRKNIYASTVTTDELKFGIVCIDYATPEAQEITITNTGNVTLDYTLPVTDKYNISIVNGDLSLEVGQSVTISVQPRPSLAIANYAEDLLFAASKAPANVTVSVTFKVVNHSFGRHVSNGDATYTKDGTKSAECLNKCGTKDTIDDPGSMKKYSADNNTVEGLLSKYEHHRTVRFTAFGSGTDDKENYLTKRFRPVSWYVNDDFNGEFEDDYDVVYTHTTFGEYTLTIHYVEEELDATTGEWVETGVVDEKSFDYSVGTTEEEEKEVVMPNTILKLIFNVFAKLLSLLGIGG